MSYILAIDVGGTFTDLVLAVADGSLELRKQLSCLAETLRMKDRAPGKDLSIVGLKRCFLHPRRRK